MYSGTEGLLCKSHGLGTTAKYLTFKGQERLWTERPCLYENCADYKAGKCKAMGLMKCFPVIDLAPNPYRFETRSINTIIGLESSFFDLMILMRAAHMVKQIEAAKELSFDGLFGAKLFLIHRKVKSGGRNIFITDMEPTPEFSQSIMEPIKRGLAAKAKQASMIGEAGSISLLGDASDRILAIAHQSVAEVADTEAVPLELEDQKDVAINFNSDADEVAEDRTEQQPESPHVTKDAKKQATETLLDPEKSPKKEK
jgi:hypothetical protein